MRCLSRLLENEPVADCVLQVRYFYGDSSGGQGYQCISLGGVVEKHEVCYLRARAVSAIITVQVGDIQSEHQTVPGLVEHSCDPRSGMLCTW